MRYGRVAKGTHAGDNYPSATCSAKARACDRILPRHDMRDKVGSQMTPLTWPATVTGRAILLLRIPLASMAPRTLGPAPFVSMYPFIVVTGTVQMSRKLRTDTTPLVAYSEPGLGIDSLDIPDITNQRIFHHVFLFAHDLHGNFRAVSLYSTSSAWLQPP
jgi:hypothetical protein